MIRENLEQVKSRMTASLLRAGRPADAAELIAVSKTKPAELLMEAYAAGVRDFGENRVQELVDKYEQLPKDIRWHMIGHLQRNKVKYLIGRAALIHSVDSLRLAEEISREAVKRGAEMDILIEVNAAGEESKFGTGLREAAELVWAAAQLPGIHVKGLMTVAPLTDDPEKNRKYFRALRELSVDIANKKADNISMGILSMGMTGDYEVALEEGSTCVRVGTGIFGMRSAAEI